MAITRDQVTAAVEKYLPKTVNYVRDASAGTKDTEAVFERIQQIILQNLLTSPDSVFYNIYLATQQLRGPVESVIQLLDNLSSQEQLKGITGEEPRRIQDLTKLRLARSQLVRLSSGLATDGTFGDEAFTEFSTNLEGFMTEELVPNTEKGGNKTVIEDRIRSTMEELQTTWDAALAQRELTFTLLDKYLEEDLRTRVSADIISGVSSTLRGLEVAIPTLSTEDQALATESTLVDLAAAEAALNIIGNAPEVIGDTIAGPARDGRTTASYLAFEGRGRVDPVFPVLRGDDGRLRLQGPNGGAPFTSTTGRTVEPGVGRSADRIEDTQGFDFLAEGIEPGMYITFVNQGLSREITDVTSSLIVFNMGIIHEDGVDFRYAVTFEMPGQFFKSIGTSFWDEYGSGQSSFTSQGGGVSGGEFIRVIKVSGTDGTTISASGTNGTLYPQKSSGFTTGEGVLDPKLVTDFLSGSFITDGVLPGDQIFITGGPNNGSHTIIEVIDESQLLVEDDLTLDGGGQAYVVGVDNAQFKLEDPDASFLTDDIFWFEILPPSPQAVVADAIQADSQTRIQLSLGPYDNETGVQWRAQPLINFYIYSASVDFLAAGVVEGDIVEVEGQPSTFVVNGVESARIFLSGNLGAIFQENLVFEIYAAENESVTNTFQQTSVSPIFGDIVPTTTVTGYQGGEAIEVEVPTILEVDGVEYSLAANGADDPEQTVVIAPLVEGYGDFVDADTLIDEGVDFIASGVDPLKHGVRVIGGANTGRVFSITAVTSETELDFTGSPQTPIVADGETYEILPKITSTGFTLSWEARAGNTTKLFFDLIDQPFAGTEGQVFVFKPNTDEEIRTTINTVLNDYTVYLDAPIPSQDLLVGLSTYALIDKVFPGYELVVRRRRHTILNIADENTLELDPKLSNAPGINIPWFVVLPGTGRFSARIRDEEGAAEVEPTTGFPGAIGPAPDYVEASPNIWADARVEITADTQIVGRYLQGYDEDQDGFAEAFQVNTNLKIGLSAVPYRVLLNDSNESNLFIGDTVPDLPADGDFLAVWGFDDVFDVLESGEQGGEMRVNFTPFLPARLSNLEYVITRGGSRYYGKYLLYKAKNDSLEIDADTKLLRLRVAEVLTDFGEGLDNIIIDPGGPNGEVVNDGDDDGLSAIFQDPIADFSGALFGDRLTCTYDDGTVEVTFVDVVVSSTEIRVDPQLPEGTSIEWVLDRNSVSAALFDTNRLRAQYSELLDVVNGYFVPPDDVINKVIEIMEDQGMDRTTSLLLTGAIDEVINMTATGSSFSSYARDSLQAAGGNTFPTPETDARVGGVNPETGLPATSSTYASPASAIDGPNESSEALVSLARIARSLKADELVSSLSSVSSEEQRNRAIYQLTGTIASGFISDTDPTLPWIAVTGSAKTRLQKKLEEVRAAILYILEHPDEFCEADLDLPEAQ